MALSDERIAELKEDASKIAPLHRSAARPFARAIEAEVRKEYEARIAELEARLDAVGAGGVTALIPKSGHVQEPFGYFKAEPFGWTDCAETDEGAVALYEAPFNADPLTKF